MWFALFLACAPTTRIDAWTPTRAACGFTDGETIDWLGHALAAVDGAPNPARHVYAFDADCAAALLTDIGGEPEALLDEVGYAGSLDEHVAEGRLAGDQDALHSLVSGLFWLLASDYGTVGAAEAGPFTDPTYEDAILRAADDLDLGDDAPLSQVLYDYVANRVIDVELADIAPADMLMRPGGHLLVARDAPAFAFESAAAVLVHEARHRDGAEHVPCPAAGPVEGRACDAALDGATGFEVATLTENVAAMPTGATDGCDAEADAYVRRRDYTLRQRALQWDTFILLPRPPDEMTPCYAAS